MHTVDLRDDVAAITDRARPPNVGHLTINAFVLDGPAFVGIGHREFLDLNG